MAEYAGKRDPRFVAIHRGGTLDECTHRLLASWAADCAEHVLPLFEERHPQDLRPRLAIATARAFARGEAGVMEAREAAYAAHDAARESDDAVASAAARAAGHAVATAHMADHELGGAFYAIRAVRAASAPEEAQSAAEAECRWQRERLPDEIRELVLSDQQLRAKKFQGVFGC